MTDLEKFTACMVDLGVKLRVTVEDGYTFIHFGDAFFEFDETGCLVSYS